MNKEYEYFDFLAGGLTVGFMMLVLELAISFISF